VEIFKNRSNVMKFRSFETHEDQSSGQVEDDSFELYVD